jgi:hypothetical protein
MTVSVFGNTGSGAESLTSSSYSTTSAAAATNLFYEILHEIPSLSPRYSHLVDVVTMSRRKKRSTNGLSWSTAVGIVLFVFIVSTIAVFMLYPKDQSTILDAVSTLSSFGQAKTAKPTLRSTSSSSPWDATTVATTSTRSTKSSYSSSSSANSAASHGSMMSMYLGDADVETLSRSAACPLTEQQRLVDWLVPIVGDNRFNDRRSGGGR